jgi:phosphatidylglycerophosphatase C
VSGATHHRRSAAVFDFDKTLINIDVVYHFLDTAIKRSRVRQLAVGILMPVLLPFLLLRPGRTLAMSTIMWIATFPLRGRTARDVFSTFAAGVFSPPLNGRFYDEGLSALAAHHRLGHHRLIISGSPEELVRQVTQTVLKQDIVVIGSQVGPLLGGLVYRRYCMGTEKIKLAKAHGLLHGHWDYGYSDSALDIPLLAHCRHRFLVNPGKKTIKRVNAALGDRVTILKWTNTTIKNTKENLN